MNDNKLDRKRMLSLDDCKNSFKKKIREETNFPNSSSEADSKYKTRVDLTSINNEKGDATSGSCSCKEIHTVSKADKTTHTRLVKSSSTSFKNISY